MGVRWFHSTGKENKSTVLAQRARSKDRGEKDFEKRTSQTGNGRGGGRILK